jgi:hypothetical protein
MVNKQNMRLAVAALRSDEFEQGGGALKEVFTPSTGVVTVKHCCLGVFCEVAIRHGVNLKVETGGGVLSHRVRFDHNGHSLPPRVQEFFGLEQEDPEMCRDNQGQIRTAVWADDIVGWTFEQIATGFEDFYGLREDEGDTSGTD